MGHKIIGERLIDVKTLAASTGKILWPALTTFAVTRDGRGNRRPLRGFY